SCEVVPALEAQIQTIAPIESAIARISGPVCPRSTKIRQVINSVATVIPEIGLDDDPISPVIREETVAKKKPKTTTIIAPSRLIWSCGISQISTTKPIEP